MQPLHLLFGLRARVTQKPYIVWGLLLAVLKFALDGGIFFAFTGKTWSPLAYLVPSLILRSQDATGAQVSDVPQMMHVCLVLAALPFLWVGLTMSVRRAADAGLSPWLGVFFLVPLLNYAAILLLSMKKSQADSTWEPMPAAGGPFRVVGASEPIAPAGLPENLRSIMLGLLSAIGIGVAMIGLSVFGLGTYGMALFFVTPFAMGAASSAIYNAKTPRTLSSTIGVALLGTGLTGLAVLLFAIEGVLCLAMALPIAAVLSTIGAVTGWSIMNSTRGKEGLPAMMLLGLPLLGAGEAKLVQPTLRHATTTIEVDAPPEKVWPNVVGFSELKAPPEWFFKLGVSYPVRAKIHGTGVGAVRHCEFSTGPFVEPITSWDPPRHLAFDVTSQPPSMTELSPYKQINAPHLEGYMTSKGGEFLLKALPGGRTRIVGTTHYTLAIYPEGYWVNFAALLLHAIHKRVLTHIKGLSEDRSEQITGL
jgi:uncharacterized membrane protein YhaH (DUF805 family)